MTEKQKKFKILKKESYEEQISKESKAATINTFLIGFFSAATLCIFSEVSKSADLTSQLIHAGYGLSAAGFTAYNLKGLIEAISRKTMLQGKIEDINTELDMPENKESRDIRR